MPKTVRIIAGLIIVGLTCSAFSEGNPVPLIVMAGVAWVVWQVAKGFAGV